MEAFFRQLASGTRTGLTAHLARGSLSVLSLPYGLAVAGRNWLYDHQWLESARLPVPVVSVGNITLGGTGKTPFVEFVARYFQDQGRRPAIISRGYRSDGGPNDEALVLARRLPTVPHLQGKNRLEQARLAIARHAADVLVLDDGFQHRRLARDLDIVLVDCIEPFGYGRLFPRGLLREPTRNLARADLVVLSRSNRCSDAERDQIRLHVKNLVGETPIIATEHRPTSFRSSEGDVLPIRTAAGLCVAAFCGIGNPDAFWRTLRAIGTNVVGQLAFPDHHPYTPPDLLDLDTWVSAIKPDLVLCTEKDLVKIDRTTIGDRPLLALQIEVAIRDGEEHLMRALGSLSATGRSLEQAA